MSETTPRFIDTHRYKRLVETSNDLVWSVDTHGILSFVNDSAARRIYGYTAAEMVGRRFVDFAAPDHAQRDALLLERVGTGEQVFAHSTVHLRKDGERVHLNVNAVVETEPTGEVVGATGTASDISRLVRAAEALEKSEERYRLLFENGTEPIGVLQEGRLVFFNRALVTACGYAADDIRVLPFSELVHPEDRALTTDRVRRRLAGETVEDNYVIRTLSKNGDVRHMRVSASELVWGGQPAVLIFFSDVTAQVKTEADLEFQAYHDPLTALPNRALFADRLHQALARARRHREPIAVLYADLDYLKRVNDTLGHSVGDLLLKEAALRIRSVIRQEDTVARFGGDEFVVLLSRVRDGSVAALVAANLIARMNEPMQAGPHTLRVTTSVGVAVWPSDGADAESLIRNADHALYQAKDQGRNCYRLFAAAMNDRAPRRLSLEQSLLKAIEASGFSLVYQPQFDLRSSSLVGYEALVRWNDWGLGHVAPASFIPVAEEIRVIDSIGAWVLDRALQDAGRFAAGARLAINVSAVQLRDRVFPKRLSTLLNTHGFPAERLELELAESATLAGDEAVGAVLTELRGQGVRIAIDDFGRGYASLAQLRRLPADLVKIDQTFIAGIDKSPADSAIVLGMIGQAHGLGLTVVAKGVETEAQRDFLHAAGCDFAQGFLLGRPLPLEELGR